MHALRRIGVVDVSHAAEHGALGPGGYCEPCGFKAAWSHQDAEWFARQVQKQRGQRPGVYRCPSGNRWHVHSVDDDARVAAGYDVPPLA